VSAPRRLAAHSLLLALFLAAVATPAVVAQAPAGSIEEPAPLGPPLSGAALDRATEEVASLMRCPVCQGLSVADSPASSAIDLKNEVRRQLAQGYTRDQVIAAFERSYGEFIRLEPKAVGFNWLVWLMPILAFLVGALVIFLRLRPRRPAAAERMPPAQEESKLS
jgi:cytochrome c-type biogenesis protein CcmH